MTGLRGWGVLALLLAAATWFVPEGARAFPDEPNSLDEGANAHDKRFQILGELAVFGGRIEGDAKVKALLSPLFQVRFQLAKHWILDTAWGFSYINLRDQANDTTSNSFRPGNPWAAIHYQGVKGQFSYRFGVGMTAPVARLPDEINTPDNTTAVAAYSLAAALRGNTSYWLWDPHSISVIVPLAFERRKPNGFLWGANLSTGIMLKCCGSESARNLNQRNDPVVELGSVMAYQAVNWLRVGSTFTLAILPRGIGIAGNQKTQLALQPFMRFGSEDAFASVGVVINLDDPWGFSFDKEQVWGLRIGGGAAF
ncbi:MAG: hypothetical protein WBG86_06965 [Polyangiales bacterium]